MNENSFKTQMESKGKPVVGGWLVIAPHNAPSIPNMLNIIKFELCKKCDNVAVNIFGTVASHPAAYFQAVYCVKCNLLINSYDDIHKYYANFGGDLVQVHENTSLNESQKEVLEDFLNYPLNRPVLEKLLKSLGLVESVNGTIQPSAGVIFTVDRLGDYHIISMPSEASE